MVLSFSMETLDFMSLSQLFTPEQNQVREAIGSFLRKEARPLIQKNYRSESFPEGLIPAMGRMGLLGSNLKTHGLPGMDAIAYGLVMKELERVDSGLRSFASVQGSLVMYPISEFGSEEQKDKWLPALGRGEAVGCFGLTESEGGSDPGAMKTRAEDKGDHYLLNGSKMWITNGTLADVAVVWAKLDGRIRGFIVESALHGFTAKKMEGKLSLKASDTGELYFDNVKLPKSALLPKSDGLKSALMCLSQARYGIAWGVLGAAEACLDEAIKFTQNRKLFGKTLAAFQLPQRKMAIMASRITQAQLLAFRLGQLKNEGKIRPAQISMAKQANVETALEVARMARDILGANGIMDEYQTMRHLCNLESVYTYEGTNDIHLLIVGKELTGVSAIE